MSTDASQYWATVIQVSLVFGAAVGIEARWGAAHVSYDERFMRRAQGIVMSAAIVGLVAVLVFSLTRLAAGDPVGRTSSIIINAFLGACASSLIINPVVLVATGRNLDLLLLLTRLWPWSLFWRTRRSLARSVKELRTLEVRSARTLDTARNEVLSLVRSTVDDLRERIEDGRSIDDVPDILEGVAPEEPEFIAMTRVREAVSASDRDGALNALCGFYRAAIRTIGQANANHKHVQRLLRDSRTRRSELHVFQTTPDEARLARAFAEYVEREATERLAMPTINGAG